MNKTYYEFINEISPEEAYEALLAYGMFAEKLPPFLSSVGFYNYCIRNNPLFAKKQRNYIYYESMRNINIPRPLGIPNPIAYKNLCWCISEQWYKLQEHFRVMTCNQNYKVSRIHIRKTKKDKAIFHMNYKYWKTDGDEIQLLINNNYIVKADISKCFDSIYTHSIPWALVGKEESKCHRGRNLWYNKLDTCAQNTKYGETHGLLIGPHTSNLLSETIFTVIDRNMFEKGWKYTRNIDDYECYVKKYEDAEKFLKDLQYELRQFNLTLNHKKTSINKLPKAATEEWVRKINAVAVLTNKDSMNYKDARAYLDNVIDIADSENDNSAVLNYAIKVLSKRKMTTNAIDYVVKIIFHLVLIYPYLTYLLEDFVFETYKVSKDSIKLLSEQLYQLGVNSNNYEAISYSIYFANRYSFELENINIENIVNTKDCITYLISYIYFDNFGPTESLKILKDLAIKLSKNECDFDSNWVFVYEVLKAYQLKTEWKNMKKNEVTFIKFNKDKREIIND